jgi:hypothetical protein
LIFTNFVWNGSVWVNLDANIDAKPDNITVTNVDGNKYTARWFGDIPCSKDAKGAYWFLSNLLVTRLPDGSPIPANPMDGATNYTLIGAARNSSTSPLMDRIYSLSVCLWVQFRMGKTMWQ